MTKTEHPDVTHGKENDTIEKEEYHDVTDRKSYKFYGTDGKR